MLGEAAPTACSQPRRPKGRSVGVSQQFDSKMPTVAARRDKLTSVLHKKLRSASAVSWFLASSCLPRLTLLVPVER